MTDAPEQRTGDVLFGEHEPWALQAMKAFLESADTADVPQAHVIICLSVMLGTLLGMLDEQKQTALQPAVNNLIAQMMNNV